MVSEHTVIRSVQRLHSLGYLRIEWGKRGRRHPNQYWATLKDPTATAENSADAPGSKTCTGAGFPDDAAENKTCTGEQKTCTAVQENHLKNHRRTPSESSEGEREHGSAVLPSRSPPAGGSGNSKAAGEHAAASHNAADRFDELRVVWARPYIENDAADRQAFKEACGSTDPEVIIAAARRWVKAADAPRFLPSLAKWLNARGWEKPPPKKHRNAAGGRRGRKTDLTKVFLKQGAGWVDDEDGGVTDPETGRTLQ